MSTVALMNPDLSPSHPFRAPQEKALVNWLVKSPTPRDLAHCRPLSLTAVAKLEEAWKAGRAGARPEDLEGAADAAGEEGEEVGQLGPVGEM